MELDSFTNVFHLEINKVEIHQLEFSASSAPSSIKKNCVAAKLCSTTEFGLSFGYQYTSMV